MHSHLFGLAFILSIIIGQVWYLIDEKIKNKKERGDK